MNLTSECVRTVPTSIYLVSAIPGRQRWSVPAIENQPRLAGAVQAFLAKQDGVFKVEANALTGRILLEWEPARPAPSVQMLADALRCEPLPSELMLTVTKKPVSKTRKLVGKLILGGAKLSLILSNRLIWGAVAVTPLSGTIAVLSVVTTVITGYDFLRALGRTLIGRSRITTGTLIGAATISSLALRENVTALIVLWLLNLGEYLEILTLRRTRRAIRELLSTEDEDAWLLVDGLEINVPVRSLQPGDQIVVREGRRIPIDGVIEEGGGTVNESAITGESMPVVRRASDSVFAGSILLAGRIRVRVSEVGADTVVGRLIKRVEEAQSLRPRIQTVGDAFAKRVVPSSFIASLLVFLITRDPRRALTMLLVACPCAAGLATPTAVSASVGNGARRGILIKGGRYIEAISEVDTICFDKTGTLTEGQPKVQEVRSFVPEYKEEDIVRLAARAELHSQHPLALAILEYVSKIEHTTENLDEFEIIAGRGVRAWQGDDEVLVGNRELLAEFNAGFAESEEMNAFHLGNLQKSVIYVAHMRRFVGAISVYAAIRQESATALNGLDRLGVKRVVMLTGDSETVAQAVARQLHIGEWRSKLLPSQKFDAIQEFRDSGLKVAMIGDGINDAPALALADVGIAMGTAGSDVAIETADIALAADDLRQVPAVIDISRHTMSVIKQNYGLSLGVSSIGLYLAALGRINPIVAAVLHNLSTIMVIANSARLINYRPFGQEALPEIVSGCRFHDPKAENCGCCNCRATESEEQTLEEQTA